MATSVRTKALKAQTENKGEPLRKPSPTPDQAYTRKLEQAIMDLEDAVYSVLTMNKGHAFHDVDFLYWNRRLNNIAMQVSMALGEYRGPRRFHYHYRHDPKNHDTMVAVSGPAPLSNLARVCREALTDCCDMTGITDQTVQSAHDRLEQALRFFLHRHQFRSNKH